MKMKKIEVRTMARLVTLLLCYFVTQTSLAQPQQRRNQQARQRQQTVQKSNANNMTTRAQISFPVAQAMSEDVVWRRDIYRELDLNEAENAGLYYPKEAIGSQVNLFVYIFQLVLSGRVPAYEYSPVSDSESFEPKARVKGKTILDNYHIYYEVNDEGRMRIDPSDYPSAEVKSYYLKESAYYDQANAEFHRKVVALCPVLNREDDFGDGTSKYPLFWVKYDDLAPFLGKHVLMTSDKNNAATMSADDFFTKNMYKGKIYKTNNLLGQTLAQVANGNDSIMKAEQKKIEDELLAFEKTVWGDPEKKDSLDSIANAQADVKVKKKRSARGGRRGASAEVGGNTSEKEPKAAREPKVRRKRSTSPSSSSSGSARVSVRRQRH